MTDKKNTDLQLAGEYQVWWSIQIAPDPDAPDPVVDVVLQAWGAMQDPESIATFFRVVAPDGTETFRDFEADIASRDYENFDWGDDEDWDGGRPPAPLLVRRNGVSVYQCWDAGEQDMLKSYIFTTSPSGDEDGRLAFDIRDLASDLNTRGIKVPCDYHGDPYFPMKIATAAIDAGLIHIGDED